MTKQCDQTHYAPACVDPDCWVHKMAKLRQTVTAGVVSAEEAKETAGLVGEIPPLRLLILPHEADYLARLISVDHQRMIVDLDHARAYGSRNFQPPAEYEYASSLLHSLAMARTSATIEAMEALEEQRADTAALAEAKPGGSA